MSDDPVEELLEKLEKAEAERNEYRDLADKWRDDWTAAMDQRDALQAKLEKAEAKRDEFKTLAAMNLKDLKDALEERDAVKRCWQKASRERVALVAYLKNLQAEVEDDPGLKECMGEDMCDRLKRMLEDPQG